MTTCSFTATTPYLEFCRELRPLLPAGLTNKDREKLVGQKWRELSEAGRATYKRGLAPLITTGRGGFRKWAPTPPTKLPTPPSAATFLVGRAAAVSVCASVSAERTAKTAPPSPDPEDQPAAKRRAYPPVDLAGSPYPENQQRRAYQEAQSKEQVRATISNKREYHKRPPGRAPNGENGAPMQWDSDLGGYVPTSADDPRVKSSAAKDAMSKDAAMAAAVAASAAAAARKDAADKPIIREKQQQQTKQQQRSAGNYGATEVVTDGIEVVRHEEMDGHNDAGHQQPEWASAPHQSSVHKQPKGPVPHGENGSPMQWDANIGGYVQGPDRMKQRVSTPDVAAQANAVQGEAVQDDAAQDEAAETWQQAQRRARKEARQNSASGIATDADGYVIGPDWGEPEATIVTDGVDDGIMSGNAAAAAAAIAAAPKFDMGDDQNDPSKFDVDDTRKRGSDPNVATEQCVSLQASVNDYWCSTVCSNGACPKHLCKCGAEAEEASANKAANAAAPSSGSDDAAAAMQAPNSAATPNLQCVNVSPIVTVDWCVSTCSHGRCPPRFCKCGADALEAEAESAAAAVAPAAAAASPALPIVRERVAAPPKAAKDMECTPKSITVTADWCRTSCSAGGNCPKALCACVSADGSDSAEIAFPGTPGKGHHSRSRATELRRETGHQHPNRRR